MFVTAENPEHCFNYAVVDLETGEKIRHCIYADDESGEYCCLAVDRNGLFVLARDDFGRDLGTVELVTKCGRIKVVRIRERLRDHIRRHGRIL